MAKLIITNGESASDRMREAGFTHDILTWRDILHEGPVPRTATLETLSTSRINFLAERGWSTVSDLTAAFARRDAAIRDHARYDEVVIWLEHDLYDQLQLLQILDFFASEPPRDGLSLIQAGKHLGRETPAALRRHIRLTEPLTRAHLDLARISWNAFRGDTPAAFAALLRFDTGLFPFLRLAILRHMEEFPAPRTGLTRTESIILASIQEGRNRPRDIFGHFSEEEDAMFMGDWSFWHILDGLGQGHSPLITGLYGVTFSPQMDEALLVQYLTAELRLTNLGWNALQGRADASVHRRINRWMGGVHLTNASLWRWDADARRLRAPD